MVNRQGQMMPPQMTTASSLRLNTSGAREWAAPPQMLPCTTSSFPCHLACIILLSLTPSVYTFVQLQTNKNSTNQLSVTKIIHFIMRNSNPCFYLRFKMGIVFGVYSPFMKVSLQSLQWTKYIVAKNSPLDWG